MEEKIPDEMPDQNNQQAQSLNVNRYLIVFIAVAILVLVIALILFQKSRQQAKAQANIQPTLTAPILIPTNRPTIPILHSGSPTEIPLPTRIQLSPPVKGNCPKDLYYFENEDFSICYPYEPDDPINYYPEIVPFSIVAGKQNNIVSFGTQGIRISVVPYQDTDDSDYSSIPCYGDCSARPECHFKEEKVSVAGFSAERKTLSEIVNNNCGDIERIWTRIDYGSNYPLELSINREKRYPKPPLIDAEQYNLIEQTMKIKL